MKIKTTLILLAVLAGLTAFVLVFESRTKARQAAEEKEQKLVDLAAADVEKMSLANGAETILFAKDEKGRWLITSPVEAPADDAEVGKLAEDFSSLKFDRLVEAQASDPKKYEIPKRKVTLWFKGRTEPVRILIGMENPIDSSLFAMREGDKRVVLLASFLKSEVDKKTLDFRQKDVFKFEAEDVAAVRLKAKDVAWAAAKKAGDWVLEKPVAALAKKSRIEDVLRALAGLRAKEFVSENKQDADLTRFGLKDPEYVISLSLPAKNQEVTFSLHKQDDKTYATTSLSTKIILADAPALADLERKPDEVREKQVAVFNSWDARKLRLTRGGSSLAFAKDAEGNWHVDDAVKAAVDRSKVETLIRKIESLEALEFIDSPAQLGQYGLAYPQAEIAVSTGEGDKEKEVRLLVGAEDAAKKQVVVRNPDLSYLFRVDASFLGDIPKDAKEWQAAPAEEKKPQAKESPKPEGKK